MWMRITFRAVRRTHQVAGAVQSEGHGAAVQPLQLTIQRGPCPAERSRPADSAGTSLPKFTTTVPLCVSDSVLSVSSHARRRRVVGRKRKPVLVNRQVRRRAHLRRRVRRNRQRHRRRRGVAVAVRDRVGEVFFFFFFFFFFFVSTCGVNGETMSVADVYRRLPALIVTVPPRLPVAMLMFGEPWPSSPKLSFDSSPATVPMTNFVASSSTDASCPSLTATGVSSSISTLIVPVAPRPRLGHRRRHIEGLVVFRARSRVLHRRHRLKVYSPLQWRRW